MPFARTSKGYLVVPPIGSPGRLAHAPQATRRECLRCGRGFEAPDRVHRLCLRCRAFATGVVAMGLIKETTVG